MILVDDRFKPQDKVGVRRRQIGSHVTTRVVSALTEGSKDIFPFLSRASKI